MDSKCDSTSGSNVLVQTVQKDSRDWKHYKSVYTGGNKGLESAHFDESISLSNPKLNVWRRIDYFFAQSRYGRTVYLFALKLFYNEK